MLRDKREHVVLVLPNEKNKNEKIEWEGGTCPSRPNPDPPMNLVVCWL